MNAYDFDVIFTLEARSNVMLDVIADYFSLSDSRVFNEIQGNMGQLRSVLASKGIQYADLKRALVPSTDRLERAFVFDWTRFESGQYGREVHHLILPLLERRSSRSVLAGDWIAKPAFSDIYRDSFGETGSRALREARRLDTLYVVYMNNLTRASVSRLETAMACHRAYLGSMDMTCMSLMKAFLSTMLMRLYIQHRGTIIQGHEDDRADTSDINLIGYDFRRLGYANRSVALWMYGWFLSYKIERPILGAEDSDSRFSQSAMTATPFPVLQCSVELDEAKLGYLQREKADSLKRAGLHALTAKEVSDQIQAKLAGSYIYNLARATNGDTLKFNIIIEDGSARSICALEYHPQARRLKVITLM